MPPRNNLYDPFSYPIYGSYQYQPGLNYTYQTTPIQNQQPVQQPVQHNAQTNQNGGFISVKSRQEAEQWPIAPGASLTFKDESKPYQYYAKSRGLSQFDEAVFESFHLVKDDEYSKDSEDNSKYALKEEFDLLLIKVDQIAAQIDKLQSSSNSKSSYGERTVNGSVSVL